MASFSCSEFLKEEAMRMTCSGCHKPANVFRVDMGKNICLICKPFQNAKLIQGECLEEMDKLPDQSVDMILCDLPYGTSACKWDQTIDLEKLWAAYRRLCKGTIVLTASQPFTSVLVCSNLEEFKYQLVWEKTRVSGFLDAKFRPLKSHEDICVFSKHGCSNGSISPMLYNPQNLIAVDVPWTAKTEGANTRSAPNKEGRRTEGNYPRSVHQFDSVTKPVHPTQKPVQLMEYLIKTYTNEGMTVLDNCMGSGTTGVACVNTKRNFIGIEKDPDYFKICQQRIKEAEEKKDMEEVYNLFNDPPQGEVFA
jgi:site-specific DNA-methyltransferase (adenine-specific)